MKQIVTIIAVLLMGYVASAQSKPTETAMTAMASTSYLLDTNTNTEVNYYYSPVNYTAGNNGNFTLQVVSTKVSGTVSGGHILQSTVDGVNWNNLDCSCTLGGANVTASTSTQDSAAVANVAGAQTIQFRCIGVKAKQIRDVSWSSGTMVYGNKVMFLKD